MTYYGEHFHNLETQLQKEETGSSIVGKEGWMKDKRALTYQKISDP